MLMKKHLHLASFNDAVKRRKRSNFNCPLPISGSELAVEELIADFWSEMSEMERECCVTRVKRFGKGEVYKIVNEKQSAALRRYREGCPPLAIPIICRSKQ